MKLEEFREEYSDRLSKLGTDCGFSASRVFNAANKANVKPAEAAEFLMKYFRSFLFDPGDYALFLQELGIRK